MKYIQKYTIKCHSDQLELSIRLVDEREFKGDIHYDAFLLNFIDHLLMKLVNKKIIINQKEVKIEAKELKLTCYDNQKHKIASAATHSFWSPVQNIPEETKSLKAFGLELLSIKIDIKNITLFFYDIKSNTEKDYEKIFNLILYDYLEASISETSSHGCEFPAIPATNLSRS